MTPLKLEALFGYYQSWLKKHWPKCKPERLEAEEDDFDTFGDFKKKYVRNHICWMCEEGQKLVRNGRMEKAFRWLGFIQGCLTMLGYFSLSQLKHHSRPETMLIDGEWVMGTPLVLGEKKEGS